MKTHTQRIVFLLFKCSLTIVFWMHFSKFLSLAVCIQNCEKAYGSHFALSFSKNADIKARDSILRGRHAETRWCHSQQAFSAWHRAMFVVAALLSDQLPCASSCFPPKQHADIYECKKAYAPLWLVLCPSNFFSCDSVLEKPRAEGSFPSWGPSPLS